MRRRILTIVILTASAVGIVFAARGRSSADRRGASVVRSVAMTSPVDALDYTIQERFRTIKGFGISRISVVPEHMHEFDPESGDEKAAVAELRSQGWDVGFYLGGRGLLELPLSETEWDKSDTRGWPRRTISKPIVIAGDSTPSDLPRPWELQEIGREALEASVTGDRFTASLGRWSVDVRPIRASRAECLKCHAPNGIANLRSHGKNQDAELRIGDALGVAIYLYARK